MNNLTNLELDVLKEIFFSYHLDSQEIQLIVGSLNVKDRIFSSPRDGECSGFYTHLTDNLALTKIKDVPTEYSVQAKFDQLSLGEMGFFIFCDPAKKSLKVIEGFLYGDDRISIEELLKDQHSLLVYSLPGL